jgi:amino acid transporter
MKNTFKKIVAVTMFMIAFAPALALAQVDLFGGQRDNLSSSLGLGNQDPRTTAGNVIGVLMGFLGIIAVVIILLGGFKWMTAGGDESKVEEAKKLMTAGVIGLAIVLASWGVTIFVLDALLNATGGTVTN